MTLSMISNTTIADVAEAAPTGFHWSNVYFAKNREVTKPFCQGGGEVRLPGNSSHGRLTKTRQSLSHCTQQIDELKGKSLQVMFHESSSAKPYIRPPP